MKLTAVAPVTAWVRIQGMIRLLSRGEAAIKTGRTVRVELNPTQPNPWANGVDSVVTAAGTQATLCGSWESVRGGDSKRYATRRFDAGEEIQIHLYLRRTASVCWPSISGYFR